MRRTTVIALAVVLIVVICSLFVFYDLNGHSLDPTDREIRVIITDSMDAGPTDWEISTIPKDSIVMIHHLDRDSLPNLNVGDVLAFRQYGEIFTHRIVSIDKEKGTFVTMGDNTHATESVSVTDAVGKVVGVNHMLGQAVQFVRSNAVYIVIAIVFVFASYCAVEWIFKHGEKGKNDKEM